MIMSDSENGFGARFINRLMAAPAKLDRPTPIRMSVTTDWVRNAAMVMRAVAVSAPMIAAIGKAHGVIEAIP